MKYIDVTKVIRQNGNSLVVSITKEVGMLGLGRGDSVNIRLVVEDDEDAE